MEPGHIRQPTTPLLFGRWLPPTFGGHAVAWMPDPLRWWRNVTIYVVFTELLISFISMGLGAARGNLGKASDGIHAALILISLIGLFGAIRLRLAPILFHGMLAVAIPAIFALFVVLTLTVSQGSHETADAIVILIFISLAFDLASGVCMLILLVRLSLYAAECKRQDEAAARALAANNLGAAVAMAGLGGLPEGLVPIAAVVPHDQAQAARAREARNLGLQEHVVDGGAVAPPNIGTTAMQALMQRQQQHALAAAATGSRPGSAVGARGAAGAAGPTGDAPVKVRIITPASSALTSTTHDDDVDDPTPSTGGSATSGRSPTASVAPAAAPAAPALPTAAAAGIHVDDGACNVCMERKRSTAFYPCGHMACDVCAQTIRRRYQVCHVCRKPIRDALKVFDT